MKWISCLWFIGIIPIIYFIIDWHLATKSYVFSPELIKQTALSALQATNSSDHDQMFQLIASSLHNQFPASIRKELDFVFINSGGWMGSFSLLHASTTEYVLIFGTALPTHGHSGRYWADIYDTLLTGRFRQWKESSTRHHVYIPGDTVIHAKWEATAVEWIEDTWMLEYGRGCIPSTLLFALGDSFSSTFDLWTVKRILVMYVMALLGL